MNGTPTPPTPTPTPPPANTTIGDLRSNQIFANDAAKGALAFNTTSKRSITGTAARSTLSVSYDATAKSYAISTAGRSQTFLPTDLVANSAVGEARYEKTDGSNRDYLTLVTTPYSGNTPNQYVGLGYWQRNVLSEGRQDTQFDAFTYGLQTSASGMPRTGSASFDIDVFGLTTTPGTEPRMFQGRGSFDTDLAAGIFSTNTYLTETSLVSSDGTSGGGIQLQGAGKLSASDGSFSGSVLYGGFNVTMAGVLNGRFYGPAAQELGAAFSASNADGSTVTGGFTGQRDTSNPAVNLTLTKLVAPQLFFSQEALLSITGFDGETRTTVRTMRLISQLNLQTSDNLTYGPGISSLPGGAFTNTALVQSSDPNFTAYEKTFSGQPVSLELYKPGSGNTELALTYASFGRWRTASKNGVVSETSRVYFAYGLETPAGLLSARTGSAHYAGVVYGAGANEASAARYDVSGTSRFDVDFSGQSYSGALAMKGVSTNGAASVDFGSYDFTGKIFARSSETVASLTRGGQAAGELSTRFFGPDGEELAGPFTLQVQSGNPGAGTTIAGVTVAKRQ